MRRDKGNEGKISSFLLYLFGFLLLWEWLRPLSTISDTNYISIFVIFTGFLFLLSYLQLPFWLSFPIKLMALLYAVHTIFFPVSFFDFEWLTYFISDIKSNMAFIFDGSWETISPLTKTVLFLILLWLISYLMHYWLIQTRKIFLFFLVTVFYVTVIDTFTPYDATFAIIRTVIVGFVLLGVLRFMRIIESEGFSIKKGSFPIMWVFPLIFLICFSSLLGFIAPKAAPQWPDPVPFIRSTSMQADDDGLGLSGIKKIGYGVDDSHLGGPFVMDDEPLFTAETQEMQYWKVETKEIYTGKGWETKGENITLQDVDPNLIHFDSVHLDLYNDSLQQEPYHARIQIDDAINYQFIVLPGELKDIVADEGISYRINPITGKLYSFNKEGPISLKSYELDYTFPKFSVERLTNAGVSYPEEISSTYLQLPKTLPKEVKELAEEITAGMENAYEKAKAIERYFSMNGFQYEITDVAVPTGEKDYVAQFLFESKKGYCDNFSSSMVVMLRTLGIPARWVKGFTHGDYKDTLDDDYRLYEITNANAHSWVEVYFPNNGWVPFEPTKGFSSPYDFVSAYYTGQNTELGETNTPVQKKEDQIKKEEKKKETAKKELKSSYQFSDLWLWAERVLLVFFVTLLIMIPIAYFTRKKWLYKFYLYSFKRKNGDDTLIDAYQKLLSLLKIYGISRDPHMTLREFAKKVDHSLDSTSMLHLTLLYEKARYGKNKKIPWSESRHYWENLIKKLPS